VVASSLGPNSKDRADRLPDTTWFTWTLLKSEFLGLIYLGFS